MERLIDHFASDTKDEVWLRWVGEKGWVVLTKDRRIRKREAERSALLDAGAVAFVLIAADLKGPQMAQAFVRAYPRMQKMLRDVEPPFIAEVDGAGKVRLLTEAGRRAAKKKEGDSE